MQPLAEHLAYLLRYQGWAHARLLDAVEALPEEDYQASCGLFFDSLHGTLNHLAVVERIWLARWNGVPAPYAELDERPCADRATLRAMLSEGVLLWQQALAPLDDHALLAPFDYRNRAGKPQHSTRLRILTHLVNHGTHHRGQASAALSALGRPAPVMDLLYFPDEQQ